MSPEIRLSRRTVVTGIAVTTTGVVLEATNGWPLLRGTIRLAIAYLSDSRPDPVGEVVISKEDDKTIKEVVAIQFADESNSGIVWFKGDQEKAEEIGLAEDDNSIIFWAKNGGTIIDGIETRMGYRLTRADWERTISPDELPQKPRSMSIPFYNGGSVNPNKVPDNIWQYCCVSASVCGANEILIWSLITSETPSLGNPPPSYAGAIGVAQIMPDKWSWHTVGMKDLQKDPKASVMAAGGILVFMELNKFFEQAALARKRSQTAEKQRLDAEKNGKKEEAVRWLGVMRTEEENYYLWKDKFINRFMYGGTVKVDEKTTKRVTCWNSHGPQANWVFNTAMTVLFANKDRVDWKGVGDKY